MDTFCFVDDSSIVYNSCVRRSHLRIKRKCAFFRQTDFSPFETAQIRHFSHPTKYISSYQYFVVTLQTEI